MLLEDPSLQLGVDKDTGQTLLSGQGELHLEVVADRLRTEHNVDVTLGPIIVAYREALATVPVSAASVRGVYDREVGGKRQFAAVTVQVEPTDLDLLRPANERGPLAPSTARVDRRRAEVNSNIIVTAYGDGASGEVSSSSSDDGVAASAGGGARLPPADVAQALQDGISGALARGPLLGYAIAGTTVTVTAVELTPESTLAAVAAAAAAAVRDVVAQATPRLLEPLMRVNVAAGADQMGDVLSDLTGRRRGRVLGIDHISASSVRIDAEAPLSAMTGYASALRSASSGYATFSMQFGRYAMLSPDEQSAVLSSHGWREPVSAAAFNSNM